MAVAVIALAGWMIARVVYQSFYGISVKEAYKGTIIATKKGGAGRYVLIDPNHMSEWVELDLSAVEEKLGVESLSIPVVERGRVYLAARDRKRGNVDSVIVMHDKEMTQIPLGTAGDATYPVRLVNTEKYVVIGREKEVWFLSKEDFSLSRSEISKAAGSEILPYRDGVILTGEDAGATYCSAEKSAFLFTLPQYMKICSWYIPGKILLLGEIGHVSRSAFADLEGNILQKNEDLFWDVLGNEPRGKAVLALMKVDEHEAFNLHFQVLDLLRTDIAQMKRPYIYDLRGQDTINLPEWAEYGIWLQQDFDLKEYESLAMHISKEQP